jgi:hypothetical protein
VGITACVQFLAIFQYVQEKDFEAIHIYIRLLFLEGKAAMSRMPLLVELHSVRFEARKATEYNEVLSIDPSDMPVFCEFMTFQGLSVPPYAYIRISEDSDMLTSLVLRVLPARLAARSGNVCTRFSL